jgi:hypothetical protein
VKHIGFLNGEVSPGHGGFHHSEKIEMIAVVEYFKEF